MMDKSTPLTKIDESIYIMHMSHICPLSFSMLSKSTSLTKVDSPIYIMHTDSVCPPALLNDG